MTDKNDIRSMEYTELKAFIEGFDVPSYRAKQVFKWLHQNLVNDFSEMTNIPASLKEELDEAANIKKATIKDVLISKDGSRKYLFELDDGILIESVLMRYKHGNSVCVSTQAGCDMGCIFCASTINGCKRNLKASEMLSQVYEIQKDIDERVSNVVMMGMGEPLLNYDNVVRFIALLSDENALHISRRNITISTCGIVPAIRRMADETMRVTLALSLHAPNNHIRQKIMPVAKKYPIEDILDACEYYFEKTGRRVTYEYCLIGGINDSKENARELALLLKGRNAHINLIPVNPVSENGLVSADEKTIGTFIDILEKEKINVTRRREIGRDIEGACGQLVRREF